jgi:uncharacterized phage protein (TIGR02218 family)
MRAIDLNLKSHLMSGATTLATCWRIARRDGAVFGFTDHDRALSFGGTLFEPDTGADGAAISSSADLSVDNSEIAGLLSSARLSASELMSRRFDEASVEIWRVNWADVSERILLKRGVIGEVKRDGAKFTAEIRGDSYLLDQPKGRVYQRRCDAVLGDARCGVDLNEPQYKGAGAIVSVIDDGRFTVSGLGAFADNWFEHGRLNWLAGANAGTSGHVKAHGAASLSLWLPAGQPVAVGDTFEIFAGCDKAFETCRVKFANAVNFRGFHLMPGNDFIIEIAAPGGANNGGRRG